MEKALQIIVEGRVQRIYFRASTKHVADQLRIKGFVRNEPDGKVYIEAEGDHILMEEFVEWCKTGPDKAEVTHISMTEIPLKGYQNFTIAKK